MRIRHLFIEKLFLPIPIKLYVHVSSRRLIIGI